MSLLFCWAWALWLRDSFIQKFPGISSFESAHTHGSVQLQVEVPPGPAVSAAQRAVAGGDGLGRGGEVEVYGVAVKGSLVLSLLGRMGLTFRFSTEGEGP
jgi:hypothetical protein